MLTHQPYLGEALSCYKGKSVFIAAPMSGFNNDHDYQESRELVLKLINHLKDGYAFSSIYYAGKEILSQAQFTGQNLAMKTDLEALRQSNLFVLLYPAKVLSSVLVEAGYAMACNTPMILLVKNRSHLPYFFQEAERVEGDENLPSIEIREYQDYQDITRIIDTAVPKLLKNRHGKH